MSARPDTALDELAKWLATPAKSGIYLSRSDLVVLARLSEGSFRFSERHRMLADVLRSSQSLEELSQVLERLLAFCRLHRDAYSALAETYPRSAPIFRPWLTRLEKTTQRLLDVQAELKL